MFLGYLVLKSRFRLVHYHFVLEEYELLHRIFRFFRLPVIATFHGSDVNLCLDDDFVGKVAKRIVSDSKWVTAVSENLRLHLQEKLPDCAAKTRVIHNSCNPEFWNQVIATKSESPKAIDVLFVGGLIPVKGPDLLLEAIRIVAETKPDVRAVLIGEGTMRDSLETQCEEEGLSRHVEFVGVVPHDKVVEYYRRSRLVAIPSHYEGHSLVAIEAGLSTIPVAAFDVGGIREIVMHNETGVLVSPENTADLAEAILSLLSDREWADRMGRRAREQAIERFRPERMVRQYLDLYSEI